MKRISDAGAKKHEDTNDTYCIHLCINGIDFPVYVKYVRIFEKIHTKMSPRKNKIIMNTNERPRKKIRFIHFFGSLIGLDSITRGVNIALVLSVPIAQKSNNVSFCFCIQVE